MTPVIFLIIRLVVILIIAIHQITAQNISDNDSSGRITIIKNRKVFLQINIKQMLIAELNVKLRDLKIILIGTMIVIIILINVVIKKH